MPGFLYFFPGLRNPADVTPEFLSECGLSGVFDKPGFDACPCGSGPSGTPGLTTAPVDLGGPICQFHPDQQTWKSCADGKFWLGWYSLPAAKDLERAETVDGFYAILADKSQWVVPVAKVHPASVNETLPATMRTSSSGKLVYETRKEYEPLINYALQVLPMLILQAEKDYDAIWEVAIAALAVNYRVSKWEVGVLGILEKKEASVVCGVLCDLASHEFVIEAQKKIAMSIPAS